MCTLERGSENLLVMGTAFNDFAWDYLQDHKDLSQIQEFFSQAIAHAPDGDFPYSMMVADLVKLFRTSLDLQLHENDS